MTFQLKNITFISITRSELGNNNVEHYLEVYPNNTEPSFHVPIKSEVWTPDYVMFYTSDDKYIIEYDNIKGTKSLIILPRVGIDMEEIKETFGITKNNIV